MDNSLRISIPVVIVVTILLVMVITFGTWKHNANDYVERNLVSHEEISVNDSIKGVSFPIITAKNMRIKQGTSFNIKDYVVATDNKDGDISSRIEFYGTVNTNVKGLYEIRCVVRNSYGLKTVRTIQVIVD